MISALTEEQRDALQELMNISMGQAANALARLIEAKIALSIPKISSVTPAEFIEILSANNMWHTRQSFLGTVKGEVVSLQSRLGCEAVAELMDYDLPLSEVTREELLLELSNILAGACLSGFAEQLELTTKLSMPTVFEPEKLSSDHYRWAHTLLMEVEFKVESSHFDSKIVICLEQDSIATLLNRLNLLLE
ncbi:chemotaxis protein CheC [Alishewanella sp. SMS8]|uniref:chemotaxis protein CheC n=1 Tax=Alishewanella sp. SMS8 TaxID=2994676 RepID=UPI0027413626|nr:chemotaxis protein CheC [Alishewanella sp. SMS8]MDP5035358.1 chemotaxis protein CheC [Alishewanella sp.]MDP5188189.1 chemotaxis protein CheC [Alishewanella sp.]MDP5458023.1 chemotaxis protein CheC [Alishewanella sp. SMS8]